MRSLSSLFVRSFDSDSQLATTTAHYSVKEAIDEVIKLHDIFLVKSLKECLLFSPQLLRKVEQLKTICLLCSTSIQLLELVSCISDMDYSKAKPRVNYNNLRVH